MLLQLSYSNDLYLKASALVAALLQQISSLPAPYGADPPQSQSSAPNAECEEALAKASVVVHHSAPSPTVSQRSDRPRRSSFDTMSFNVDFGDTSGVQTRGKKATKKAAKQAQQAAWFASGDEGEGGAAGEDGEEGAGGGDGSNGAGGGGGDDNGGGGGDDGGDDWAFGGNKKTKKKSKKKEEEEEEQKRKDEEAANAAGSLNWADDANTAAADDDWAAGFTAKKDKKKKGKKVCSILHSSQRPFSQVIGNRRCAASCSRPDICIPGYQSGRWGSKARVQLRQRKRNQKRGWWFRHLGKYVGLRWHWSSWDCGQG